MLETNVKSLIREAACAGVKLWVEQGRLHFKSHRGVLPTHLRAALAEQKDAVIGELSRPVFSRRPEHSPIVRFPAFMRGFWQENEANTVLRHGTHVAFRLTGELTQERIESALSRLTARHDLLRARMGIDDVSPFLVAGPHASRTLYVSDLSSCNADSRSREVQGEVHRAIYAPFQCGDLFRASIIKVSDHEYAVAVVMHHFVSDFVTLGILVKEFIEALRASDLSRFLDDERRLQYFDYLFAINEWLEGAGAKYRLRYWKQVMHDAPATSFCASEQSTTGPWKLDVVSLTVGSDLRRRMADAIRSTKVPFIVGLLTVYFAALAITLRRTDVVVAFLHSGRIDPALSHLVGFTADCVPLRIAIAPRMSFIDLMMQVHEVYFLAMDYQIPWGLLIDVLPEIGGSPIARLFNYLPTSQSGPGGSDVRVAENDFELAPISYDVPEATNSAEWKSHELHVWDSGSEMFAAFKYMPQRYRESDVDRLAKALVDCMEVLAETPAAQVFSVSSD